MLKPVYILEQHNASHIYKLQECYKQSISTKQKFWYTQSDYSISSIVISFCFTIIVVLCKSVCPKVKRILYIHTLCFSLFIKNKQGELTKLSFISNCNCIQEIVWCMILVNPFIYLFHFTFSHFSPYAEVYVYTTRQMKVKCAYYSSH